MPDNALIFGCALLRSRGAAEGTLRSALARVAGWRTRQEAAVSAVVRAALGSNVVAFPVRRAFRARTHQK